MASELPNSGFAEAWKSVPSWTGEDHEELISAHPEGQATVFYTTETLLPGPEEASPHNFQQTTELGQAWEEHQPLEAPHALADDLTELQVGRRARAFF